MAPNAMIIGCCRIMEQEKVDGNLTMSLCHKIIDLS